MAGNNVVAERSYLGVFHWRVPGGQGTFGLRAAVEGGDVVGPMRSIGGARADAPRG